jgi:predicted transcriptional regulator
MSLTVAVPPASFTETPTIRYRFADCPTVWFQETVIGFPVDAVAGEAFEAAS